MPQKVANCGYCGRQHKSSREANISNETMTCNADRVKVLNSEKVGTQHECTEKLTNHYRHAHDDDKHQGHTGWSSFFFFAAFETEVISSNIHIN